MRTKNLDVSPPVDLQLIQIFIGSKVRDGLKAALGAGLGDETSAK